MKIISIVDKTRLFKKQSYKITIDLNFNFLQESVNSETNSGPVGSASINNYEKIQNMNRK